MALLSSSTAFLKGANNWFYVWIYSTCSIGYILLFLVWIVMIIIYRRHKIRLIVVLSFLPVAKMLQLLSSIAFMTNCALTDQYISIQGREYNTCIRNAFLLLFYQFGGVPWEMAIILAIMFIATGYGITMARINHVNKRAILWHSLTYLTCLNAAKISDLFQILQLVMYFVIAFYVFASLLLNMKRLKTQVYIYRTRRPDISARATPPFKKYLLLRSFQYILTMYFMSEITLQISRLVVLWYVNIIKLDWVFAMVHEIMEFGCVLAIAFILRLRSFKNCDRFNDMSDHFGLKTEQQQQQEMEQVQETKILELAKPKSGDKDRVVVIRHPGKSLSLAFTERIQT